MSAPKIKPELVDLGNTPQIFVDDLCQIDHARGVTHLVFAATRRKTYGGQGEERWVEVRLVVPTQVVEAMAKAMLNGCVEPAWKLGIDGDEITVN
jgi:hypothetical protein